MKMMKMSHSWLGMIKSKRQDIFGIARLLICHSDRSSLLQFCKYTEKKISEILLERTIDIYLSRWKGECYIHSWSLLPSVLYSCSKKVILFSQVNICCDTLAPYSMHGWPKVPYLCNITIFHWNHWEFQLVL